MLVDPRLRHQFFCDASADAQELFSQIDLERLPRHVSIIMDGNGRWAQLRGKDRSVGHRAGVDALRETVTACVRMGIDVLSVYAFSTENWKRPAHEVSLLMKLFASTLMKELPLFLENNVRLRFFGDLEALPLSVQKSFNEGLAATEHNTGMVFALAVNYGARSEILKAAQQLCHKVLDGCLAPEKIDRLSPEDFAENLYTHGLPDPDLLIRTSGELRLSNYLLWQLAYSELYVTQSYWPDFNRTELLRALLSYQRRERRYGGISDTSAKLASQSSEHSCLRNSSEFTSSKCDHSGVMR